MLIDKVRIHVRAGRGGNGCVSFRREKFVPRGGPDGGDGGKGGDVYVKATARKHTLLDFHYRHHFKAEPGRNGQGSNRSGKSAEDVWIEVPVGTIVYDEAADKLLADLNQNDAFVMVAKGGRGGKGNVHFATATAQAPEFAQEGEPGEERVLNLELKMIADVGLIGLPNAGKSTLLSRISAARPKIASYPFTTLQPVLGTVRADDRGFVVADIPGLIEGASEGIGLGLDFLRHIERTRVLLHLVDVSAEQEKDPVERYKMLNHELTAYGKGLPSKPQMLVATKIDVADPDSFEKLKRFALRKKLPFFAISAHTGQGLPELLYAIKNELGS
jgi:GTP-binding protein